jgi:steroid delta-isomerase
MAETNDLDPETRRMLQGMAEGPSPEHVRSVFVRYGDCMTAGDLDGVMSLYAEDATLEDPVGTGPQRGHAAIRRFYQAGFEAMGGGIEMRLEGNVRIAGRHGAAAYIARTIHHSEPLQSETLDVMVFDDDGRIRSMTAYWGPANMSRYER